MSSGDVIGLVGVVVGVVGIVVGVLFAKRRAKLVFFQDGRVVVEASPNDELEVRWRGHAVPAFTRTRVWIGTRAQ